MDTPPTQTAHQELQNVVWIKITKRTHRKPQDQIEKERERLKPKKQKTKSNEETKKTVKTFACFASHSNIGITWKLCKRYRNINIVRVYRKVWYLPFGRIWRLNHNHHGKWTQAESVILIICILKLCAEFAHSNHVHKILHFNVFFSSSHFVFVNRRFVVVSHWISRRMFCFHQKPFRILNRLIGGRAKSKRDRTCLGFVRQGSVFQRLMINVLQDKSECAVKT